jgi:hypothetical protein
VIEELVFSGHLDPATIMTMPLSDLFYWYQRLVTWAHRHNPNPRRRNGQ